MQSDSICVGLHDYRTDPGLPQRDGVNFAHENFTLLLRQCADPRLQISFHDFSAILADEAHAREILAPLDCVFANVGPHAHYYFWLREKLGLNFRIVRDVRTAIWSSYLLQEHLVAPLLRDEDTLLFASNYAWAVYRKIFADLQSKPSAICYPLTIAFPPIRPAARARVDKSPVVTIGYLGRLSDDKNFPSLVDLIVLLNRESNVKQRFRLLACGDVHSLDCQPESIEAKLVENLGPGNWFEYIAPIENNEIWTLFPKFDYMLFPSTSNLETFGRVLIEASFAGVPVIAGDHAAASELIDAAGLCPVTYRAGHSFAAHFDHRLGQVDLPAMARAVLGGTVTSSSSYQQYAKHDLLLFDVLAAAPDPAGQPQLTPAQQRFVKGLEVSMPPRLDAGAGMIMMEKMAGWFLRLQAKNSAEWEQTLAELHARSMHQERTERFIKKARHSAADFTNVGGIDIELCHIARFYPRFQLDCGTTSGDLDGDFE